MDLRDISLMGRVGIFLMLFIICIATLTFMIAEFTEIEEELGITPHTAEFENLKFLMGFIIILCMAGCTLYLWKTKKKKKEDQDGN